MTPRSRAAAAVIGATAAAAIPATVIASSYVVRPGDTLSAIAQRHNTTISALVNANQLANPDVIRVGQLLRIPDTAAGLPGYTTGAHDVDHYTVQHGDGVLRVARHFGLDPTALARANGIGVNATLHQGAVLQIPGRLARANALLTSVAHDQGVDPRLVRAVSWMESGWQQDVVSPTGAIGLMQVEPYTGEWIGRYLAARPLNLRDAHDNVVAGTMLLKHLLSIHGGDVVAALAAYYQGDASIARHGLFSDTRQYRDVIVSLMHRE